MITRCRYILLASTIFGCVQLASEFDRVRSSPVDAATDRGSATDRATPAESAVQTDVLVTTDVPGMHDDHPDGAASADIASVTDTGVTDLDAGPPGPLRLRAQGFSSGGIIAQGGGSLRLVEWGFEQGQTTCAGTLCVTGGVTP